MAYRHSQDADGKRTQQEEVEIIGCQTDRGVITYIVRTRDGIECTAIQVQALSAADKPLKAMYECFMENNGDLLRRADTAVRVLYQTAKDWKNQNQM